MSLYADYYSFLLWERWCSALPCRYTIIASLQPACAHVTQWYVSFYFPPCKWPQAPHIHNFREESRHWSRGVLACEWETSRFKFCVLRTHSGRLGQRCISRQENCSDAFYFAHLTYFTWHGREVVNLNSVFNFGLHCSVLPVFRLLFFLIFIPMFHACFSCMLEMAGDTVVQCCRLREQMWWWKMDGCILNQTYLLCFS